MKKPNRFKKFISKFLFGISSDELQEFITIINNPAKSEKLKEVIKVLHDSMESIRDAQRNELEDTYLFDFKKGWRSGFDGGIMPDDISYGMKKLMEKNL